MTRGRARLEGLRTLASMAKPRAKGRRSRLSKAQTVEDLRRLALRTTPRAVFDYVDGGAEEEIGMRRAREAFSRVEFTPRVLRDSAAVDPSTTILGRPAALPVVLAPTGFTRMVHDDGEAAVARAAARAGVPYVLSTMGTTTIEEVAAAGGDGARWFQIYVWKDRGRSRELIERARDAGYGALVVTVDVPVAGMRLRDARNGMTIPPAFGLRTMLGLARYPGWWLPKLTGEPLAFEAAGAAGQSLEEVVGAMFDPSVTWDDLAWIRDVWPGPIVLKGIQGLDDAGRAAEAGVEAIVLSSHGGRQLDRAPTPLELLPRVADSLGDRMEILVDTGVRSGSDAVAAVGLGARACLIGRSYLYGLMAGGERGVDRVLEMTERDLTRTLRLLGAPRLDCVDRSAVRLRP